jgi:Ca2+-binding RTX toxin-like protein
MTTTTQTGAEYISAFMSNAVPDFPFNKYLSFGTLSSEDWTSQTYDPDSIKKSISFKSTVGSTIKYSETRTGTDTQGTDVGSATIIGKVNGTNMSISGSDSWTDAGGSYSTNLSWTYTGGTATKTDDFKLKASNINKESKSTFSGGSKGTSTEQKSIDFTNADYSFSVSASSSGQWNYSDSAGSNTVDKYSSNLNYSFKDIQNNSSLTMSSVKLTEDSIAGNATIDVASMKYLCSDFSIATTKFSKALTIMDYKSLPDIGESAGDLGTISNLISNFLPLFLSGDNTISITSKTGLEINGGAGNDTITGGIGNDTIAGGAGKDKLTGGKGDDVFKLSKSDYDFTSAKTVLADTITDFKYTAAEKDAITLDGFGSFASFQTIAAAKKAGSTANVIYESKTGNFWYNEDGDSALVGALLFANAKGIPDSYWVAAGMLSL